MSGKPTALREEIMCDPLQSKQLGKDEAIVHNNINSIEEFSGFGVTDGDGDGDSDSEEIGVFELKTRMWKDQMLLRKLEGTSRKGGEQSEQCTNPCQCLLIPQPRPTRKTLLRAEDGVLHYMLKMMQDCDARGFVYGILPNTGAPITGSSDSLRAWWKDTVEFDRNAPHAVVNPAVILPVVEQVLESYLHQLQDMNDNTIGSILSALMQHCVPPQRSCPLDQGLAPPWWPTGEELWWGLQGQTHAELGPPPYRKPHDLRKGWKLSVLAAVIKHMSPRFDHMRSLVWQSKRLQHKMSAKDVDTWSRVLNQEEALVEQTKQSLVITPLEDDQGDGDNADNVIDDMADTRKRKWGFENLGGTSFTRNSNCWEADLLSGNSWPNVELEGTSSEEAAEQHVLSTDNSYQCSFVTPTENSGVIASLDDRDGDEGDDSRSGSSDYINEVNTNSSRRKLWGFEEGGAVYAGDGDSCLGEDLVPGDLWPNVDLDLNSINELMRLYPQDSSNGGFGF